MSAPARIVGTFSRNPILTATDAFSVRPGFEMAPSVDLQCLELLRTCSHCRFKHCFQVSSARIRSDMWKHMTDGLVGSGRL